MTTIEGVDTMPQWVAIVIIVVWIAGFFGMLCWLAFHMIEGALRERDEKR